MRHGSCSVFAVLSRCACMVCLRSTRLMRCCSPSPLHSTYLSWLNGTHVVRVVCICVRCVMNVCVCAIHPSILFVSLLLVVSLLLAWPGLVLPVNSQTHTHTRTHIQRQHTTSPSRATY